MAKKRGFTTFSLSFLDIMSCGFGAVALIFLIIKHDVDVQAQTVNKDLLAEVNLLEEEVRSGEENLVRARNTLSTLNQELADAQGLARRINNDIDAIIKKLSELEDSDGNEQIKRLQERLKSLEKERKRLEEESENQGRDARSFVTEGDGDRQYLTGLKLGGAHILILLDASASMLDNRLVNIIRRKNMSDNVKRAAKKWRRAIATVEWLIAKLPPQSQYQLYTFNTDIKAAIDNSENQWLEVSDSAELNQAILNLRQVIPDGGTSLERTFLSIQGLTPLPDNIILITDGLPTQGLNRPKRNTISGPERVKLFNRAVREVPGGIPVNIILSPMEGDPMAAASFWQLAQNSRGSFLSPSKDWP